MGNAVLLIGVVGTCVWLIRGVFDDFYARELASHLRTHAEMLRHDWGARFDLANREELDLVAKAVGSNDSNGIRVTFVDAQGRVLGDSRANPEKMVNHSDRPEIKEAMLYGFGESSRFSNTVRQQMSYVAVRVGSAEEPQGVVRVSMPVRSIVARTRGAGQLFWQIAAIVLVAAVILALGLARIWSSRIGRVTATARSLSAGDLSARADVGGSDEVGVLAGSLNQMRDHLAGQLKTIDRQRRTLEYLLAQLHEGVVVASTTGRIVLLNPAAARLFGREEAISSDTPETDRLSVEACVPHEELRAMLRRRSSQPTLALSPTGGETDGKAPKIEERRVALEHPGGVITLLARAANIRLPGFGEPEQPARSADGNGDPKPAKGRLLVLTDITELTRTIQIKTDFVANASHELRTPLSAIRAGVETVMSMDLSTESQPATDILEVIDRQSARLSAIVADLLELSRVESPAATFEVDTFLLSEMIDEVRDRSSEALEARGHNWIVNIAPDANPVEASRHLLRLVMDNLIENAIKFTEPGGRIEVTAERRGQDLAITVSDNGCGIPPDEQERVFERFYQVERARSGSRSRGTGLGLSIVRHAVNAMHGAVEIHSEVGAGTRIVVSVPQRESA